MTIDFVRLANVAEQMIGDHGEAVSIRRKSRTPANSSEPWKGPAANATTAISAVAVFAHPTSLGELGRKYVGSDTERTADQIGLVAAAAHAGVEIETFDTLVDSASHPWRILWVDILQPGATRILYLIGVKR